MRAIGTAMAMSAFLAMTGCDGAPPAPASGSASSHAPAPVSGAPAPASNTAVVEAPARPASAAELAIMAPLGPGAKLEDHEIREVRGVTPGSTGGTMEVHCEKGTARVILSIALVTEGGPSPPASTDRYAVFYSVRGAPPEDGERLAKALAAILKKNNAAPPAGMGPFVPRPVSL